MCMCMTSDRCLLLSHGVILFPRCFGVTASPRHYHWTDASPRDVPAHSRHMRHRVQLPEVTHSLYITFNRRSLAPL